MSSTVPYERIGDMANALAFFSASVYAVAVIREWSGFDPVWKENGFCVTNVDKEHWSSHDLCLYFNLLMCAAMGALYHKFRSTSDMKDANQFLVSNLIAHGIHGLVHGYIGRSIREGLWDPNVTRLDNWHSGVMTHLRVAMEVVFSLAFWLAFVRAMLPNGGKLRIATIALVIDSMHMRVPRKLSFVFVQTAFFVVSSFHELLQPVSKKGFEYAVVPVVIGFPSTLVAWAEATLCMRGIMRMGGHLLYDGFLGVSITLTYIIFWWYHEKAATSGPKRKAA